MKKLFILTLTVLLAMTLTLAQGEEGPTYSEQHPGVEKFDGYWVSNDALTLIELLVRTDGIEIVIYRTPGEKEFTSWEYLATYDDETHTVSSQNGMKSVNKLGEDGTTIADSQYAYDDGKAVFVIGDDGKLTWQDDKEHAGNGLTFTGIGMFEGDYVCDRASMSFRWTEDHYAVDIHWANSAFASSEWQYVGEYDASAATVTGKGLYQELTYLDNGDVDPDADQKEREVEATFRFDDSFHLLWESPDGEGDGMLFEKVWTPAYLLDL